MATPWKTMESDLWSWLGLQASYAALGIQEYRSYAAGGFPWSGAAMPQSSAKLPALECQLLRIGPRTVAGQRVVDQVELTMSLWWATAETTTGRAQSESAMNTIYGLLLSGRPAQYGSSVISAMTEIDTPTIQRFVAGDGHDRVVGWKWSWSVTLIARAPRAIAA